MISAVFLDVDDTLVDWDAAARAAFRAALGADAAYERWLSLDHYERWLAGEFDYQTMRDTRMADFLRLLGRDHECASAIEQRRFEGVAGYYRLFDDVAACLKTLRGKGMLLGVITNNESVHQRDKISRLGLDGMFDAVVISGEVGFAKPDARIFTHACQLIGVEPGAAAHVGDNLVADACGARDAGLRGIWLDRRGGYDGSDVGVPVVRALTEVAALLG
jgi:putative hydrolase of the HAD superfamily